MTGQLKDMNVNLNFWGACVYIQIMVCVHFSHVPVSTNSYTKEKVISLTMRFSQVIS